MKKSIFFLALIIAVFKLSSQSYYTITFQGNNASPETVRIDNLTQGTNITINGDDVLHLVYNSTGIANNNYPVSSSRLFPNPMQCSSTLQFDNPVNGNVTITIFNITGKKVISYSSTLNKGTQSFILTDFPAGSYIYNIKTPSNLISGTFNSINTTTNTPSIKLNSETENISISNNSANNKNNTAIVEMNFEIGDALKITGYATGFEDVIIYNSPTSDKIFTFDFASTGFVCGNPFTDPRDNTIYNTVQIGNQCWFATNLKYLPSVNMPNFGSESSPFYYVYGYDGINVNDAQSIQNYAIYGVLYNWSSAQTSCPSGWHLPDNQEWGQLINTLGGENIAGGKLKEIGTTHWNATTQNTTNESGFTALPGGSRGTTGFFGINSSGFWWSSSVYTTSTAWRFYLYSTDNNTQSQYTDKGSGNSVRCIKD